MRQLTLPEVLHEVSNVIVPALFDDILHAESEEDFCTEGAITVLKQTVSAYYVSKYFDGLATTAMLYTGTFFTSFIALIERLVSSHSTHIDYSQIDQTLSSWNLRRIQSPGDGNCLFTSIAFVLAHRIRGGDATIRAHLRLIGVSDTQLEDVEFLRSFLRVKMVEEWSRNSDFYQGFITGNLDQISLAFLQDGYFTSDAGDLMVLTLSNVLQIPITIFTSIHNMPIICVLPTSGATITNQPIFLTFNHDGPGHYDIALPSMSQDNPFKQPQTVTKHRCTCGRKPGHRGEVCKGLRCCCYKSKRGCTSLCICKACKNIFGCRPPPSSTRRR